MGADGEAAGQRRVVGDGRAVDPEGRAPLSLPGSQTDRRSQGVDGDPVRAEDRDPLGGSAAGNGLRLGDDLWRRLKEWQEAGVWLRLHEVLLARLRAADRI